jgi:hypothetical protein
MTACAGPGLRNGRAPHSFLAALALALTALLSWPGSASATSPSNFSSDVAKVTFDSLDIIYGQGTGNDFSGLRQNDPRIRLVVKDPADYYVVTNTVLSGGYSGWHTHPGPSLVLVKSGFATVYDGNDPTCTPTVYPAGTGFVDPGDGHVHMIRNESPDVLVTQAFQIIPAGLSRRIDAPSPGNCPF